MLKNFTHTINGFLRNSTSHKIPSLLFIIKFSKMNMHLLKISSTVYKNNPGKKSSSPKINFYKYQIKNRANYDPSKDYYKILGISQSADDKEIKQAYYKLAKIHHPDLNKGQSSDLFKEINVAYEILSDSTQKLQYDASRKMNSFFGGKSYSEQQKSQTGSYNNNYNFYNTQWNKTNYDYKQDPFFKNFSDWFKNTQKTNSEKNYKSNFYSGGKKDNFKSYYEKNKDYFSFFKETSENRDGKVNQTKKSANKKETTFGKSYYEKNKKYYESFKKPKESGDYTEKSQDYKSNYNPDSEGYTRRPLQDNTNQVVLFIFSLLGVILGSIVVQKIMRGNSIINRNDKRQNRPRIDSTGVKQEDHKHNQQQLDSSTGNLYSKSSEYNTNSYVSSQYDSQANYNNISTGNTSRFNNSNKISNSNEEFSNLSMNPSRDPYNKFPKN